MADPLWIDFVNSDWHDWRGSGRSEDRLFDETWLRRFLERWGWQDTDVPTTHELQSAKALRDGLREAAIALVHGNSVEKRHLDIVNDVLRSAPQYQQLEMTESGCQLVYSGVHHGWTNILAQIATSFADMLADGDTTRIRFCENPDCLWLFWDTTRNASKRFCDDKTCGNLIKVRRFRERHKHTSR